jgi:hypothetical protein
LVQQFLPDFSGMQILELTSAGNLVDTHGTTLPSPGGIDQRSSSGAIYSSDAYGTRILTLDTPAPVDLTVDATAITATTATVNGTINPHNGPAVTYHFETSTDQGTWTSTPDGGPITGNGDTPVTADLTGLQPNTTYYYRLVATQPLNPATTSSVQSFATSMAAPAVTTTGGTIDGAVATLKGTVDPQGLAATYWFEYGLTTNYGSRAPGAQNADASAGDGNEPVPVSWYVNGLEPGKTYHYRLVARNAEGTTNGNDITLTPAAPGGGVDTSRGYERVSPQEKGNTDVAGDSMAASTQVALDGNSLVYTASGAYPGVVRGGSLPFTYRGTRTAAGWKNESLTPPSRATLVACGSCSVGNTGQVIFVNPDLSRSVVATNVELAPGASDATNLFSQQNPGSAFGLLTPGAPSGAVMAANTDNYLYPQAATQDLEHVVFASAYPMAPGAVDQTSVGRAMNLYEATGGTVRLVNVDENGTPIVGEIPRAGNADYCCITPNSRQHAISEDGSRIFFSSDNQRLYVRKNGVETARIPNGVRFLAANAAGSEALFLAEDSSIRRYDVASGAVEPASEDRVNFIGASESLDYIYFTRDGNAVGDPSVVPFNSDGLYLWHDGAVRLIAVVGQKSESLPHDFRNPDMRAVGSVSSVSPDGRTLAFVTAGAVNGADTNDGHPLYVYDAGADRLSCLACPGTESPGSKTALYGSANYAQNTTYAHALGNRNNISADGKRVFFQTAASLIPQDSNGKIDVYAWENGVTRLTSDGKGKYDTRFLSASPSGDDVFLATRNRLLGEDRDDYVDVYDARVGGGFAPAPDEAPVCQGDSCQGLPTGQPVAPSIGSVSFSGPGNEASAPRAPSGKVKLSTSKRTVRGSVFTVSVKVPGKGKITASGSGLRSVKRTATRAGTYRVKVQLTARAKQTLRRKHQLKVTVRVGYTPLDGRGSSSTLAITVKA